MKRTFCLLILLIGIVSAQAQHLLTPFEVSGGKRSATYEECIRFYRQLRISGRLLMDSVGPTDAGYPLHTIYLDNDLIHSKESAKVTILINNGIHPGEPDGIDASMMLVRDFVEGKLSLPDNIRLVVIPVYNIGGALNRNNSTRVNQNGPESYGFRGSSRNLDLNRDFTKCDSRESRLFCRIFHACRPDILIDNHVSDGADYQYTMTLLSTQYDKLGGARGRYFRERLDPLLYKRMAKAGWPMSPYVNVEESTPDKGWTAFYDPPRFSSGYAALFGTIAWVPETHMLKPFDQRVRSTYALMKEIISLASSESDSITTLGGDNRKVIGPNTYFPLSWKDSAATIWPFKGYTPAYKASEVSGQQRLYYDHSKPLSVSVPIRDHYAPAHWVKAPKAYIIPQAWHEVIERLEDNGVFFRRINEDTVMDAVAYTIDSFKTSQASYEGHYKHSAIHVTPKQIKLRCRKGDYLIRFAEVNPARFLVEMLEPEGEDSYFAWNFFDAILQRKEGYSDYRWEDVASKELREHPEIKRQLEARKREDPGFAKDPEAQLFFVYRHSRWFEPTYMRYPVYRIE